MKPAIEVDLRNFNRQVATYERELKKEKGAGLRQQARLLVKDLIKATPPIAGKGKTKGKGTFSQSFAAQKNAGKDAVSRDVKRAFVKGATGKDPNMPAWLLKVMPKKARTNARKYAAAGEYSKIATIWHRTKGRKGNADAYDIARVRSAIERHAKTVDEATISLHAKKRSKDGRVSFRVNPVAVRRIRTIAGVIKVRQSHVGTWKSGWAAAVRQLGIRGIPKWITGKSGRGYFRDDTKRLNPSITVANLVRGETGRNLSIARASLQNRVHSMSREIRERHESAARKARLKG